MKNKLLENVTLGISIVAIIISATSLFFDFFQNSKINRVQYEINSNNYKPQITVDSVVVSNVEDKVISLKKVNIADSTYFEGKSNFKAKYTFHIKNIGNDKASVIAVFLLDTISGKEEIIKKLLEKSKFEQDTTNEKIYNNFQLQKGDSKEIAFTHETSFVKDDRFILHLFLLYENDLEMYYNTYYWVRFEKKKIIGDLLFDNQTQKIILLNPDSKAANESIVRIDENISYQTYTYDEKIKLEKLLKQLTNNAR